MFTHVWGLSTGHGHGCHKYNLQDYRFLTLEADNTHSSNSFSNLWANGSDTFSAENRDSLGILSWSCRHSSPHHGSSRMRSGWLRGDRGSMWADPLSERPQSWASELRILHTAPLSESDTDYRKSFNYVFCILENSMKFHLKVKNDYSYPFISTEDWFQDPREHQNLQCSSPLCKIMECQSLLYSVM